MNTEEETRMAEEKLHEAERRMVEAMRKIYAERKWIGEEKNRIEETKMEMELKFTDIVDDQKSQADAFRLKMKQIRKFAHEKEIFLNYAFGVNVILFTIIIAMFGLFVGLCMR